MMFRSLLEGSYAQKKMMKPTLNDLLSISVISSRRARFKSLAGCIWPPGCSLPRLNKAFSTPCKSSSHSVLKKKNRRNVFHNLIRLRYAISSAQRRLPPLPLHSSAKIRRHKPAQRQHFQPGSHSASQEM